MQKHIQITKKLVMTKIAEKSIKGRKKTCMYVDIYFCVDFWSYREALATCALTVETQRSKHRNACIKS
jgi:hypothetical protein